MAKIDSTIATIAVAFVAAAAVSAMLTWQPNAKAPNPDVVTGSTATAAPAGGTTNDSARRKPTWAASATGRIEPKDGQVRISAQANGEIAAVIAAVNDRVLAGDLLVKLDDADQLSRIAAAEAEADVRRRERDDESKATGAVADRRKAADAVEVAERELHKARQAFDAMMARRTTGGVPTEIVNVRQAVADKKAALAEAREAFVAAADKEGIALPDRLEAALTQARSDLRLAYQALERTRVRAPFNGSVLRVDAKAGELTGPTSELPLVSFGDLSQLKVRAEVEERDIAKVRVGQRVVVRSDAFPDKDFEGRVTAVSGALGAPNIVTRGPRRPNDVDVLEVVATLEGAQELVAGMRVDVFFAHPETALDARK